ncbi:uncharacterized protein LY89DRAFT_380751 [Mollisia scopiformis]|uniref:BZIP domain-containing protein n=1 Tax=Mollisia scopiformis TaxID=149040 RepID=A0A194XN76_MOLSC|nr:uncharacterized protein LY89DRAFT_380751 [Mollisia scopiformis]KUJ21705.1 hypothetical protein LY89DRAFT_380751 [Mollisia scopiformis]
MSPATQQSTSMSHSNSQASCHDPLDSLVDFSEYDKMSYQSPSISPSTSKSQFTGRAVSNTPSTLPSSQSDLSGPSHNYGMYRQQTGIPQGAVASTLAVNQQMGQYNFSESYLTGFGANDDFVDFGTAPSRNGSFDPSVDMDFDSPKPEPAFFYPEQSPEFVNPSAIGGGNLSVPSAVLPTQSSNVGRLWPGMHQQQAALAKAQAQQKQQQQIIQQQRQNAMGAQQRQQQAQRPRGSHQPTDPIVEEKISQLLNSMRQSSVATDGDDGSAGANHMAHVQRMRKEEEDMDEDERLLASEEGKKLSSKERRQLRNKVSARAFRSRRKEYISQLEGEIATKVNENQDLRSQNRALMEENTRLSDLTRMLLSSPSFSGFLDTLASNPAAAQTAQGVVQQPQAQPQQQQQQQLRKDINPYAAQSQMQQQQIGMAMIPEQSMDFSMLDLGNDGFPAYQPQVFSVLSIPEAVIDTESSRRSSTRNSMPIPHSLSSLPPLLPSPPRHQPQLQSTSPSSPTYPSSPLHTNSSSWTIPRPKLPCVAWID